MKGVVLAAALVVCACWTGPDTPVNPPAPPAPPPPREPLALRVTLERTPCFGSCPAYTVVISGDGRVDWLGRANVLAQGRRQGRVTAAELAELSRRLDRARFFERNEYGDLPQKPACNTVGTTTTCSFGTSVSICSDTSHAILTVHRDKRTHTIENDHCSDRPELDAIEDCIDRIADTEVWIGH